MSALWELLTRYMASEGIKPADLARQCGLAASAFSPGRPIPLGRADKITPDTLRSLRDGTRIPLMDLIVASGMWTAEELAATVVRGDPAELSNDELLALVAERMRPERAPGEVRGEVTDVGLDAGEETRLAPEPADPDDGPPLPDRPLPGEAPEANGAVAT